MTGATHPDDREYSNETIQKSVKPGGPDQYAFDFRAVYPDQTIHWLNVIGQVVKRNPEGLGTIVRGTLIDITERKQAEEKARLARELFEKTFHVSPLPSVLTKLPERTVIDANEAFEALFGYTRAEVIGESVANMDLWADAQERERVANLLLKSDRVQDHEFVFKTKSGETGYGVFNAQIIQQQSDRYVLTKITDVTARKQAEEELRRSEEKFSVIFNKAPFVAGLTDLPDGVYLEVNEEFERVFGFSREEIIGKTSLDLGLYPDPESRARAVELFQKQGFVHNMDARLQTRTGEQHDVLVNSDLVDIGGVKYNLTTANDITARKQAEEKLEQQNQRLKALREIDTAILAADSVENIIQAALSHIRKLINCRRVSFGLVDWESQSATMYEVKTENEESNPKGTRTALVPYEGVLQTLLQNQPMTLNDLRSLKDPPSMLQSLIDAGYCSLCILPLTSQNTLLGMINLSSELPDYFDQDKIALGLEVANQVTIAMTQNNLLDALRQSNTELMRHAQEREELITEITAKNAELETFVYTVSHDLKSPLVTMKGFLGYLEQDAVTGNIERLKADIHRISSAVEKMQKLLDDILELSRTGRFVNPPEKIHFEELANEAIDLVKGQIQERNVRMELQPDLPIVYGDKLRLVEVLQNLIDNATKYMGDQPHPQIEIGHRNQDTTSDQLVFFVKDNGMGIPPEYHESIFGLFNKLDARSEGTGVGLALVRRIIEIHGGRIWVESEPGQGSIFYFTLPAI